MIGLDTNVIVRAVTGDEPDQSSAAQRKLAGLTTVEPGFISLIALVETIWVLRHTYGYEKETVLDVISRLVSAAELVVEQDGLVRRALTVARDANREMADVLIALAGAANGCSETVTFDRRSTSIPGMVLLTS